MIRIKGTTISLVRGDSAMIQITINDADGNVYTPAEGDSIRFAVKKSYYQVDPDLVKTIPNDTLVLTLEPADTKDLDFGPYKYDIELTTEDGEVDTFIAMAELWILEEVH